jgi:hypothetical protein
MLHCPFHNTLHRTVSAGRCLSHCANSSHPGRAQAARSHSLCGRPPPALLLGPSSPRQDVVCTKHCPLLWTWRLTALPGPRSCLSMFALRALPHFPAAAPTGTHPSPNCAAPLAPRRHCRELAAAAADGWPRIPRMLPTRETLAHARVREAWGCLAAGSAAPRRAVPAGRRGPANAHAPQAGAQGAAAPSALLAASARPRWMLLLRTPQHPCALLPHPGSTPAAAAHRLAAIFIPSPGAELPPAGVRWLGITAFQEPRARRSAPLLVLLPARGLCPLAPRPASPAPHPPTSLISAREGTSARAAGGRAAGTGHSCSCVPEGCPTSAAQRHPFGLTPATLPPFVLLLAWPAGQTWASARRGSL